MPDYFYTIAKVSKGLFKEKGSKFIAIAFPVKNQEEIKSHLENVKKDYHDARHHCYAWALGPEADNYRANDDGEPSNSAGKPILGQINSFQLTNILVVVVRYFGGTLLGVGGLINAYRTASRNALEKAKKRKEYLYTNYQIEFEYPDMNITMKILKDLNVSQLEQNFEMSCTIVAKVRDSERERFEASFKPYEGIQLFRLDLK